MKLTENFTLEELIFSPTAIKKHINQKPSEQITANLKSLCEHILQPIRHHFKQTIKISSAYRSPELNKLIGGAGSSQHCLGEAADIDCNELNPDIFKYIKEHLEFDQLIWEFGTDAEPDWVHVSFSKDRKRKQVLKAVKVKGKTQYIPYV